MLDEVKGQDRAVAALRRFVDGVVSTPYLLLGDDGVGRRYSVVHAVRELACPDKGAEGCRCPECTQISHGAHPDVFWVMPEGDKDIGVDTIRGLLEHTGIRPMRLKYRVFSIDGADRLTPAAANALLKTLEEPPSGCRFFLLANRLESVLPTIRSRCNLVRYGRLSEQFVVDKLVRFEPDPVKALVYARLAGGSVGRAVRYVGSGRLRLRDRMMALLDSGISGDLSSLFGSVDALGPDITEALSFLEGIVHDLLLPPDTRDKAINQDAFEALDEIRRRTSREALISLSYGVSKLVRLNDTYHINTPFHLKTLISTLFSG